MDGGHVFIVTALPKLFHQSKKIGLLPKCQTANPKFPLPGDLKIPDFICLAFRFSKCQFGTLNTWFLALRCCFRIRSRKNRVCTCVPLLSYAVVGGVRGSSAAGPGGRQPSFPHKRVVRAPGVLATYGTASTEK